MPAREMAELAVDVAVNSESAPKRKQKNSNFFSMHCIALLALHPAETFYTELVILTRFCDKLIITILLVKSKVCSKISCLSLLFKSVSSKKKFIYKVV